jgi:hypothetical protein
MNGDGTSNNARTRVIWEIASVNVALTDFAADLDFIKSVVAHPRDAEILYEHDDGTAFRGFGKPTGDIKPTKNDAYLPLTLSGGGELKPLI